MEIGLNRAIGLTVGEPNFLANELDRELTKLRRTIIQNDPGSPLLSAANEIERLIRDGNFFLAKQKLNALEDSAKEDPVSPNIPVSETPAPEVPSPTVPEPESVNPSSPPPLQKKESPEWISRVYKDVSEDIGATFQYPEALNELEAVVRIPAHERGHVIRAVAKALVHQRRIEYAYFVKKWRVDYRHHKLYLIGGEARIKTGGPRVDLKV